MQQDLHSPLLKSPLRNANTPVRDMLNRLLFKQVEHGREEYLKIDDDDDDSYPMASFALGDASSKATEHALHAYSTPKKKPLTPIPLVKEPSRPRIPLLDNARAALIFLVVLYHSIVVYTSADRPDNTIKYWSGLLMLLKPVVMPAFCFISGHVSRPEISTRRAYELAQIFVVYLIFQCLYHVNNLISFRMAGFPYRTIPLQVFQPKEQVVTWFLFTLTIWRLLLPVTVELRTPLTVSVMLGLGALLVDLGQNYQNLFSFLPYFVAGALIPPRWFDFDSRPMLRFSLASLFVLTGAGLAMYSQCTSFKHIFSVVHDCYACFSGTAPDSDPFMCSTYSHVLYRALFYASSVPLIIGFFSLLPRQVGFWTVPGFMSMYIYLLHPLLIANAAVMKLVFNWLSDLSGREVNVWSPADKGWPLLIIVLGSFLVCILLSTPPIRVLFWPLVQPPLHVFLQPRVRNALAS